MTVKELMNILSKYDEDMVVRVSGGEDASGEWSQLEVGREVEKTYVHKNGKEYTYTDFDGEVILEESY